VRTIADCNIPEGRVLHGLESTCSGIEVNGMSNYDPPPGHERAPSYECPGDGSANMYTRLKNISPVALHFEAGAVIAEGGVIQEHKTGVANATTMELETIHEDEVEESSVVKSHRFSKLSWLPVKFQRVIIGFSCIGGMELGLRTANKVYGTSFRVCLVLDCDPVANLVHEATFPGVPCVQHILGGDIDDTLAVINQYVPKEAWPDAYVHMSPSCKEGSTINLKGRDVEEFCRMNRWTVKLLDHMDPAQWTLENVRTAAKFLRGRVPYLYKLDMQRYTGMPSQRHRVVASKLPLPLRKLSKKEMNGVFRSPKDVMLSHYGGDPASPMIIVQSMGHQRDAERPGFTVIGNQQRYGTCMDDLKPIAPEVVMELIDVREADFRWPEGMSPTKKLKYASQVVPPSFAAELGVAVTNSQPAFARRQNSFFGGGDGGDLLPDVVMVVHQGRWALGRVAEEREGTTYRAARSLVCLADNMEARWYFSKCVHPVDERCGEPCETSYAANNTVLGRLDGNSVLQLESNHPEWDPTHPKHVPWSPAFRHTAAGVATGQRAILLDGRVPCEILHVGPRSVEDPVLTARVHFPRQQDRARLGATRSYSVAQLEPFAWESSCDNRAGSLEQAPQPASYEGPRFMGKVDSIMQRIRGDESLMQQLKGYSRPEDGPGVSFLVGVNPRTGVPYALMTQPLIAELWLAIRERFEELNKGRLGQSKLTNIKVEIDVPGREGRQLRGDFGDEISEMQCSSRAACT